MGQRILILSDTHLGRPSGAAMSASALRPLWVRCDRLILNGDVAEVHHPAHWRQASEETLALHDHCERDGVQLTMLSGNHDPYLSDIRHLHLAGGQVFVTHGDALHPAIAPWSPGAARLRRAYADALSAVTPEARKELEVRLSAAQHASHARLLDMKEQALRSSMRAMFVRPWLLLLVLRYWRIFPALAAEFAAEHAPHARFIVVGHTHRPGIHAFDDRTVINTGCFGFPGTPRAVIVEDGQLSVWRIGRRDTTYRLDPDPLAVYELPAAVSDGPPLEREASPRPSA